MNGRRDELGMLAALVATAAALSAAVAVGTALGAAWGWAALSAMSLAGLALIGRAIGGDEP